MPTKFLLLSILLTWLAWVPAAVLPAEGGQVLQRALLYAGGLGPLIALVVVLHLPGQQSARRSFWRHLGLLRAIRSPAVLLAFLLPVAFGCLAAFGHGGDPLLRLRDAASDAILATAFATLLFGPLPEELAWRGYALPVLMERQSPFVATVVLASAWALWHVPLFFMEGTFQSGLAGPAAAGLFFVNLYAQSILMTALFVASRCTWTAVFFHWMTNLTGEILKLPFDAEVQRTLWTVAAAVLVLLMPAPWGLRSAVAGKGRRDRHTDMPAP